MRRRTFLTMTLAVPAAVSLAACGDDDDNATTGDKQVEIFTWWTGPGEGEGLAELEKLFKQQNSGVEFINAAVAGGGGDQARALLSNRLQANDPPDSFQGHAGQELLDYIKAGKLEDITYLYDKQGWKDTFPKSLVDQVTVEGKIYSVPVNIHRANLVWFNPKTLSEAGVSAPPKSWSEFLTQARTLTGKGKIPLAVGPLWTQEHLLETVLLGELGPDGYAGLWDGKTDWASAEVVAAVQMFGKVLESSDVKTSASDWQPQLDKIINGSAAYAVMGDWSYAYLATNKKLAYKDGYDAAASPGSDGIFDWLSDSFTLPVGAKHKSAAEKWLTVCGSKEGQDAFNIKKGSVPARTDADASLYKDYLAWNLSQWKDSSTKLVGSLAHGAVASPAFKTALEEKLGVYVGDRDAGKFTAAVKQAYQTTR